MLSVAELKNVFAGKRFFSRIKPKKKPKFFVENLDQCRRLEVPEKVRIVFLFFFFVMSCTSVWPKVVTQHRIFIKFFFFDFARIFSLFSLVFRTLNLIRNLIKQLFQSRLLDLRLVIANLALRASLAIYHFMSNAHSWNNC